MRSYLLATTAMIAAATAAHAQTACTVPGPAALAGYNTETFGQQPLAVGTTPNPATSYPQFINGATVNPYDFTGASWTNIGQTSANGAVTLNGTGEAYGNGIATAGVTPAGQPLQGIAFGGGGYFQATMASSGSFSFWMNDAETMNVASNGTAQTRQTVGWKPTSRSLIIPAFTALRYTTGMGRSAAATATTQGSAKFYFNGQQVGNTITWSQYIPGQTAAQNPYAVMDSLHMVPILGAGNGSTNTVSNLQVWQASASNDIGTGTAQAAAAQPCAGQH
jgi:hypothetical protein